MLLGIRAVKSLKVGSFAAVLGCALSSFLVSCEAALTPVTPARAERTQMIDLSHARKVKKSYDDMLMSIPGVVGTGISLDENDIPLIEVYVEHKSPEIPQKVPARIDGVAIRIVESGRFKARR